MICVPGVVICGGAFKVLGMEEVRNTWENGREIVRQEGVDMWITEAAELMKRPPVSNQAIF